MGADIHFYIETRADDNNPWGVDTFHNTEEILEEGEEPPYIEISAKHAKWGYGQRNYYMFSVLANVRGNGALYEPRGVPQDISPIMRTHIDRWASDGHSHSYLSLDEFKECLDVIDTTEESSYSYIYRLAAEWLAKEQAEAHLLETGANPQVRFVFFFDN